LGVKRICSREGNQLSELALSKLFEQFVGMELLRYLSLSDVDGRLRYWRDHNGPEVDYVIDIYNRFTPIEVKWTSKPDLNDAVHLQTFLAEYDCNDHAFIVCCCKHKIKLSDRIIAIPWQELPSFNQLLGLGL